MNATALVVLWLHAALAQDHWLLVGKSGSVSPAVGTLRLTAEERRQTDHAWVYSWLAPPRRVETQDLDRAHATTAKAWLTVQVVRQQQYRPPADERLLVGPTDLWSEVPESLVPSWGVPAHGRLQIPVDPSARVRLRVAGTGAGSWWTDVSGTRPAAQVHSARAPGLDVAVSDMKGREVPGVLASIAESTPQRGGAHLLARIAVEAGILRAPGLPDREKVALTVVAPSFAPSRELGLPSELSDIRLIAGAAASGRLVDHRGRSVSGAEVEIETWLAGEPPRPFRGSSQSGPSGTWRIAGLPPGRAVLVVHKAGFGALRTELDLAENDNELGALILETGLALRIAVRDDLGEPVVRANVRPPVGAAIETDSAGRAQLDSLPPHPLSLDVSAPRHLPAKASVEPPFAEEAVVVLRRSLHLRGRLVTASGDPVTEGQIRVEAGRQYEMLPLGDDGRFAIDLPPDAAAQLVFLSAATRELPVTVQPGSPGEERDLGDLVAPSGLAIFGRIVDRATGVPIAGARIWVPRTQALGEVVSWANRDLLTATSDGQGQFRLTGVSPGPAQLRIEASGFARRYLEVAVTEDADAADLGEIWIDSGALVRVLADAPTSGVAVARVDLRGLWLEPDILTAQIREGEAIFHHVPSGRAVVSVLQGNRLQCERAIQARLGEEVQVDCRGPSPLLRGKVLVGGEPAGPGTLVWLPPSPAAAGLIQTEISPHGLRNVSVLGAGRPQVKVPVLEDASFMTEELYPGIWEVSWFPVDGAATAPVTMELPGSPPSEVVVSFPGFSVRGRVTAAEGIDVSGARVSELSSGALTLASKDGDFAFTGLPPGRVVLQARLDELESPPVAAQVGDSRQSELVELPLENAKRRELIVEVADSEGRPATGAIVFVETEGRIPSIVTTDETGRASLILDAILPRRVRVAATTMGAWSFGNWLAPDQAENGVSLLLKEPGSLEIASAKAGVVQIATQNGWDLARLLLRLGFRLEVGPDRPLQLSGIPEGRYTLSLDGRQESAEVRVGRVTRVSFP